MKESTSAQNRRTYSSTAGGTRKGSEKVALQLRYEVLGLARQIGRAAFSRKKKHSRSKGIEEGSCLARPRSIEQASRIGMY